MKEKGIISWKVRITGRVQGVWYRKFVESHANRIGVRGWVRNEPDGAVSAIFEHPDKEALEEILAVCAEGPELARVDHIDVTHQTPEGLLTFTILRSQ